MGDTVAELIERGYRLTDLDEIAFELGLEDPTPDELLAKWEEWAARWLEDERSKLGALKYVRAVLLRRAEHLKAEEEKLRARRAAADRQRAWVEGLAQRLLTVERELAGVADGVKFSTELPDGGKATLYSRTTPSVDDFDVEAIPDDLVRVYREAKKTDIQAAIKAGREVPGARLVFTTKEHVRWS